MRKAVAFIALIFIASAFKMVDEVSDPIPCIQEKCPKQYAQCQKDPKCLPALNDCYKKCGSKKSCWELCLPGKGSQAAIDTAKCASANGCTSASPVAVYNPQDCIEKYCKKEEQTCANDRRCIATLNFCDQRCNTTITCWKDCLARAKDVNASNYFNCIIDHNCQNSTSSAFVPALISTNEIHTALAVYAPEDCIKQYCSTEARACGNNAACLNALKTCEEKCQDSQSCWTDCIAKQGNTQASAFWKCIIDHDCLNKVETQTALVQAVPQQCIEQKCPNQWAACKADPKCIPALQDCEQKCGTKVSCWTICLPPKGSQAAINTAKCAQANGCVTNEAVETALAIYAPEDCIKQYCSNEARACGNNAACLNALKTCEEKCQDNQSCWTDCIAKQGNTQASAFWKCIIDHDCLNKVDTQNAVQESEIYTALAVYAPEDCIKQYCSTEARACGNNAACLNALKTCEEKCQDSQSCWTDCIAKQGNTQASAFWKCIIDHDCLNKVETQTALAPVSDIQDCIKEKCPSQYAECQKDPKCLPTLQECQKKCGSKTTCWELCLGGKGSQAAIDTAKCAHAQGCDKVTMVKSHPFLQCMNKSCMAKQLDCLYDKHCSKALHKCSKGKKFDYDYECLFSKSKDSQLLSGWYTCAGENFCL